jgi:hypothetical protein
MFYAEDFGVGILMFDFSFLVANTLYIDANDSIMLKREENNNLIHFTFGRNLFWYHHPERVRTKPATPNAKVQIFNCD